ncbi:MAG: hypothetical protein MUO40_08725 [Anaerolineaceae bacterium]|nr:hypothetical protein [Anaerolineaceae bacterium]
MSNKNTLKSITTDQMQGNDQFSTLSRAQQKNIERRGRRALYDLPPKLIKRVANIAEEYGLTNSQVAGVMLLYALQDLKNCKMKLRDYRQASESPRYDYKVDLDKLIKVWEI